MSFSTSTPRARMTSTPTRCDTSPDFTAPSLAMSFLLMDAIESGYAAGRLRCELLGNGDVLLRKEGGAAACSRGLNSPWPARRMGRRMREPRTALLAGLPAPRTAGDRKFAAACA